MDLLANPRRRRWLFAALYLSEGAPIGFIWLALPTWWRAANVPIQSITGLTAVLVIPWTFKFLWAPLVDILQSPRWTLRHWVVSAQLTMGATILPLLWLDLTADFATIAGLLVVHALAAATQDVAIDALCISATSREERGRLNGWMQAGMLLGRATLGGGALVISRYIGQGAVVLLLVSVTTFSLLLLLPARLPTTADKPAKPSASRARIVFYQLGTALMQPNTFWGLAFALVGGAAFKGLEVIIGPFLIDRGFAEEQIGHFTAGPMIAAMIAGSLVGGRLADRLGHLRFVAAALGFIVLSVTALALSDLAAGSEGAVHLLVCLTSTAFGIGLFTAASYAMFMDITHPTIAATQFSAFMGATNGCEAWSSFAIGQIVASRGYPAALLVMCGASLAALPLLWCIRPVRHGRQDGEP